MTEREVCSLCGEESCVCCETLCMEACIGACGVGPDVLARGMWTNSPLDWSFHCDCGWRSSGYEDMAEADAAVQAHMNECPGWRPSDG